jgi:hypothetical protein
MPFEGPKSLFPLVNNFFVNEEEKNVFSMSFDYGGLNMKKKWLLLVMVFILTGCVATSGNLADSLFFNKSTAEFKEKYDLVQEKIAKIVNETDTETLSAANSSLKSPTKKFLDTDPNTIYYPDDFLEIYNSSAQTNGAPTTQFITQYQMVFDDLRSLCDFDHLVLEESQVVQSGFLGTLSVTFYNALDGHIIIHYVGTYIDEYLKAGLDENELLHLVHFSYFITEQQPELININSVLFNYEEFLEDTYHVLFNSLEGDQVDFSFVDNLMRTQSTYSLNNGEETISFFDVETKQKYLFFISHGVVTAQSLTFYNEKCETFSFLEGFHIPNGFVQISWQMLEATGWDYTIVQNMDGSNTREGDGIFKDEENLFVYGEDRLNIGLTSFYASVVLAKIYSKAELTNDILNLSAFGLTFSNEEISIEQINQSLEAGKQMIDEKIVYKDIYFRSVTLKEDIFALLDPDFQSLIPIALVNE